MRAAASLALCLVTAACAGVDGRRSSGDVHIVGSDTMLPLNRRLAATFMSGHPGAVVYVAGGGSGIGVRALIDGQADLCAASRTLRAEEVEDLFNTTGTLGIRYMVALDAIAIYLHPMNPVRDLRSHQLADIFAGTARNWSQVGGEDRSIEVVIRPPTSGTHRFFRDHVLADRPYADGAVTVQTTADVIATVAANPGAVGFGGLAYSGAIRHCAIDGVTPDPGNVRDGTYPLSRYLYYYATEPPDGPVRTFVDWVIGPEGQEIVTESGLLALWASQS